jgi:cytochrome c-type biogenesis protein CcmH/NrfF
MYVLMLKLPAFYHLVLAIVSNALMVTLRSLSSTALVLLISMLLVNPLMSLAEELSTKEMYAKHVADTIAGEINSPFCPGRLLRDCPSTAASELRTEITSLAAQGVEQADIKKKLIEKYGDSINPTPVFSGFGALAWIGPIIFFVIGSIFLFLKLKRSLRVSSSLPPTNPSSKKRGFQQDAETSL